MKKIISAFLVVLTIISCTLSLSAYAADVEVSDADFTTEYFESLEHVYAPDSMARTSGLITSKQLGIAKDGTKLLISGYTRCVTEVVKCGFTKVVVERKLASETKWSTYTTLTDLYASSNTYTLSKSVTVEKGYQYRVTGVHYAKKSLLSTEKITVTTGSLTF